VVVVQSAIFDGYRRRVVVPLVKKSYLDKVTLPRFNPTFTIEDTAVVLHPLELVSIATDKLGEKGPLPRQRRPRSSMLWMSC
jgi:toxin CcdB